MIIGKEYSEMNKTRTDAWFAREITAAQDTMFRVAFAILRNSSDAEDATQNAILKAYNRLDTLSDRKLFRTWMIRILKNECFDFLRSRRPVIRLDDCDPGYEMEVPDLDLNRAFDALSPEERLTVTLFYFEGYKTAEIAKLTDVSEGTVRSRLSRARASMKQQLTEKEQ